MGQEAQCTAHYQRRTSAGKALLETDALIFRGGFRFKIPLTAIRAVDAHKGWLTVTFPGGIAKLQLGDRAERWAQQIRAPKSLIDKLGVKPDSRVVVVGVEDANFWAQLAGAGVTASRGRLRRNADILLFGARTKQALGRLSQLQTYLTPNGALWVIAPKGGGPPSEQDVLTAGRAVHLVDVKVVRFSDSHTAHKFVSPLARRRPQDSTQRRHSGPPRPGRVAANGAI